MFKIFTLFSSKPKAIIQVSRVTGTEETTSVTVNSFSSNKTAIYHAITEAGEALRLRLIDNNKIAMQIGKDSVAIDPTKPTNKPKRTK